MSKKIERDDPHRAITPTVVGEAANILAWMEDQFRIEPRDTAPGTAKSGTDAMPETIVLRTVSGAGGRNLGPALHQESWKPSVSPLPTRERLVELSNKFLSSAQKAANTDGRRLRFALLAYSNLKGSTAYSRHTFVVAPTGIEYADAESIPASDDEDSVRDRFHREALAHVRWKEEMLAESLSSVMRLQQDIIVNQQKQLAQAEADRRMWITATEEALSRKTEREAKAEIGKAKARALHVGLDLVGGLVPALGVYLSKGAPQLVGNAVRAFLDTLDDQQRRALLGVWDRDQRVEAGILDEEQVKLIAAIADGQVPPARLSEIVGSLTPEQLTAAQQVLSMAQVQQLIALAKATTDTAAARGQQ